MKSFDARSAIRSALVLALLVQTPFLLFRAEQRENALFSKFGLTWESFEYTGTLLRPERLDKMESEQLDLLEALIMGRHGWSGDNTLAKKYLGSRPWYRGGQSFNASVLNETERRNLDLIVAARFKRVRVPATEPLLVAEGQ